MPHDQSSPRVIVLAGPNGAGKTSSSRTLLAETLGVMAFVNADVIAQGLSGFSPESVAWEGRVGSCSNACTRWPNGARTSR